LASDMETVGQLVRDVSSLASDMETVGQLVRDVASLASDMESVGQLVRDVSSLASDMETVGQLVRDVSSLASDIETAKEKMGLFDSVNSDLADRLKELTTQLASLHRGLTSRAAEPRPPDERSKEPDVSTGIPLDALAAESVYAALEDQMRGSIETIAQRQTAYVELIEALPDGGEVVDLGCGRGEFLKLLSEKGIPAQGVDLSATFVAECCDQGLDVEREDLLSYLSSCPDNSMRAVVSFQVLEHLPFPTLLRVLSEAFRVLKPGGLFLGETPNGANLAVGGSTFWLDHTHVRPLHPELLKHLAKYYGYEQIRVELVSLPEVPWKLPEEIGGDSVADAILGLQGYVLSGQDALLIAYCPEENA
jgi:SAM-dependent methyltransferase